MTSVSGIWRIAFVSFAYHERHLETQIEDLHSIQTSIQSANRNWHSTVGALKLLSVAGGVEQDSEVFHGWSVLTKLQGPEGTYRTRVVACTRLNTHDAAQSLTGGRR